MSGGPAVRARGFELGVAALLLVLALLVIGDSLRVGIGWSDDGPRSGYFPFYIGCGLLASSGWIALRQLLRWRGDDDAFADREQLARVGAVLLPVVLHAAATFFVGIYVASALLIGWFMRRLGGYRWPATAAVSLAVPLLLFVVFERWFLVLLPKGPLERLVGL